MLKALMVPLTLTGIAFIGSFSPAADKIAAEWTI
jgi:hypothetical protein